MSELGKKTYPTKKRKTQDIPLTVHIVPHSHTDLGWQKTIEEYYNGARVSLYLKGSVELILDTTIDELERDPKRTFTYVEMKFFNMWYA